MRKAEMDSTKWIVAVIIVIVALVVIMAIISRSDTLILDLLQGALQTFKRLLNVN